MSYPPRCERCKNYNLVKTNYKTCEIFDADVLSMSGNGIIFDFCQRFVYNMR